MSKNNFHPDNSKKPYTNEELFDRYARPQGKNEKPFVDRFNDAVNTKNGELFKYSAVAYLNGPNLDCICTELSRFNTRIVNQGYTLRIENIIADINAILKDNTQLTLRAQAESLSTNVASEFVKNLMAKFLSEVFYDRAFASMIDNSNIFD
ncbi:MAG: hypothetical protein E7374_02370 [Clostridiales bacterium]|nr:hypothetical protein [Clostridiales bacterium]